MDDQAKAQTGDEDVAAIELGMFLHRPPVRRIINHPRLAVDRQSPDCNGLGHSVDLMLSKAVAPIIASTVLDRFNPHIAEFGIRVIGGWCPPTG